ncbi:hypothetical protein B0H63DRAFT_2463 [Podospora didyma]|uniref:Zn(2)-C6 fungal-type domain-containing protein n=1 Tax=Podospora didyma TaxID=330526 RepID=A0AAE0U6M9_9PEZI|nr:hypothetical protein B0H63DRAFT_2463 [Podospora didyma]
MPKRPSDAADGSAADGTLGPKAKLPRLERAPEDFSNVVKSKLQSFTRTGQACDRCKVRKIRCDALPEGCSHCKNQNLDCNVTDRVTGRTERRGYLQQLERENAAMLAHIRELEKLLDNNKIEVRPWQWPGYNTTYPPGVSFDAIGNLVADPSSKDQWQMLGSLWVKNAQRQKPSPTSTSGFTRYRLLESRPSDSFLGVSSDSSPLSSIKGTTLSILGTAIDIASFDAPDMDEPTPGTPIGSPLYNKSVMAFLQSALNINPPLGNVDLPSREDAFTYAEWYFLMISPFLPILHKPSFLELLKRVYDDRSFKASVPELITVHMVFATIYYQYGIRNREEPEKHAQLNELSNKHYHWCLSKFFHLAISQTVTAVSALAMIVSHTRSFPKPGCSSIIAHFAIMKAIELNLHREVKIPGGGTTIENEVRKRAWWAILAVLTTLNGRLGRPMPITLEEFDVDFPMAIPDECLGEEGVLDPSKIGHCNYNIGLIGYKAVPLYMEMHSSIYSVRRDPEKYISVVRELEDGMQNLLADLPEELQIEKCKAGNQVFAHYAQAFCLEFSLCLRHPSVCMTDNAKFCAENTKICEETATKLLKVVGGLLKMKSLDTTWYQLAVYVAAIFSTLVAHWERRFDTSADEIDRLRDEMSQWLVIIEEIGRLLGTGTRLSSEIRTIIERTINWIEQDMARKAGAPKQESVSPFDQASANAKGLLNNPPTPSSSGTPNEQRSSGSGTSNGNGFYDAGPVGGTTPYPSLNFGEQSTGGPGAHPNGHGMGPGAPYDPAEAAQYVAAAVEQHAATAENPLIAFASQATQHVGQAGEAWRPQAQEQLIAHNSASTWHDWTAAIADSQERYSANALLTLGAARGGDVGPPPVLDHVGASDPMAVAGVTNAHSGQWPLLLFSIGTGGPNGS